MTDVLIFTHEFPPLDLSGIGNTARHLVKGLLEQDFNVTVVAPVFGKYCNMVDRFEKKGKLEVHRLKIPIYEWTLFSAYGAKRSWFDKRLRKDFDLIHSLDSRDAPFIRKKAPLIVNFNDYICTAVPFNPFKYPWRATDLRIRYPYETFMKILERISVQRADLMLPNSNYTSSMISNAYGLDPKKVRVVYKGIDLEEFNFKCDTKRQALFVGGNLEKKGIIELIDAAEIVAKEFNDVNFLAVGRGTDKYMSMLKSKLDKAGLSKRFSFVYNLKHEDIIRLYKESAMFVLPSYRDGLPQVIMEAMAASLPVVSTTIGGIPEAVEEGKNGYLVEPCEHISLAERMSTLFANEAKRKSMGKLGRKMAEERFEWRRMVKSYISAYDKVMS